MRDLTVRTCLIVYGAITALHMISIFAGWNAARSITHLVVAIPLLVIALAPLPVKDPARVPTNWNLVATIPILISWIGFTLPHFVAPELVTLSVFALFAVAEIAWLPLFWPLRHRSLIARSLSRSLIYLAPAAILLSACLPGAGPFVPLLFIHAVSLLTTAILATGAGPLGTIGGLIKISTSGFAALFAFVMAFDPGDPWHGVLVGGNYLIAMALMLMGARKSMTRLFDEDVRDSGDAAGSFITGRRTDAASPTADEGGSPERASLPPALPGPETVLG